MAKSLMNSASNFQPEPEPASTRCPAHGCFLYASVSVEGEPWTCRYHSRRDVKHWQPITELLHENKRWFEIIRSADAMEPGDYDELRDQNAFELDELLSPVSKEPFKAWKLRLKDTIYRALKSKINKLCEDNTKTFGSRRSVDDMTSGLFRKPGNRKTFADMSAERE